MTEATDPSKLIKKALGGLGAVGTNLVHGGYEKQATKVAATAVGGIVGAILTAKFMFNESFTWAGLLAVPPIATNFSISSLVVMFLVLLAAVISGIFLEGMRKND